MCLLRVCDAVLVFLGPPYNPPSPLPPEATKTVLQIKLFNNNKHKILKIMKIEANFVKIEEKDNP